MLLCNDVREQVLRQVAALARECRALDRAISVILGRNHQVLHADQPRGTRDHRRLIQAEFKKRRRFLIVCRKGHSVRVDSIRLTRRFAAGRHAV
jgi:hypothetical protein